jgi:uncharacterized protein
MKNLILILICVSSINSFSETFPDYRGVVNDFENVLSPKQEKSITKMITKTETKTKSRILVVSTKNFAPAKDYRSYILGLFNHWKLNESKTANWVLVLFSFDKKELKIIPGKDLKLTLTESKIRTIVQEVMTPKFILEKHYVGLKKGLKALSKTIKSFKTDM